jgi:hypothetical protein
MLTGADLTNFIKRSVELVSWRILSESHHTRPDF